MSKKIRILELFSGYGSQSLSLRDLGINYEIIGISEIDVDAIIGYGALRYDINNIQINDDIGIDDMRTHLMNKNIGYDFKTKKSKIPKMKIDKLKILYKCDKISNNFGDISLIDPINIPDFDYMTYSFPCTDISIAGNQQGLIKNKTRSGLLYECEKIIEIKRPKYLLMENVKALLSKKFVSQFNEWCEYLENLGYTNYYKVLNAKDFGIPQNRERIFMVSILGKHNKFEFNNCKENNSQKILKDFIDLESKIDGRFYLSKEKKLLLKDKVLQHKDLFIVKNGKISTKETENISKINRLFSLYDRDNRVHADRYAFYSLYGLCPTLTTCQGGGLQPCFIEQGHARKLTPREFFRLMGVEDTDFDKLVEIGIANTQLYKLAGNSIVKQCLDSIHKELFKDMINEGVIKYNET